MSIRLLLAAVIHGDDNYTSPDSYRLPMIQMDLTQLNAVSLLNALPRLGVAPVLRFCVKRQHVT